jgi:hypothetical protein
MLVSGAFLHAHITRKRLPQLRYSAMSGNRRMLPMARHSLHKTLNDRHFAGMMGVSLA